MCIYYVFVCIEATRIVVEVQIEAKDTGTLFFNSGRALNGGSIY